MYDTDNAVSFFIVFSIKSNKEKLVHYKICHKCKWFQDFIQGEIIISIWGKCNLNQTPYKMLNLGTKSLKFFKCLQDSRDKKTCSKCA